MLLISQPKSASTSLLEGFKEVSGLPGEQILDDRIKKYERPNGWKKFQHQDGRVIPCKTLSKWDRTKEKIYKQHILPIKKHTKCVRKFVLLTRNPKESVESYIRTGWKPSSDFEYKKQVSLLAKWNNNWRDILENFEHLHITYEDVITSPKLVLSEIGDFFNVKVKIPEEYELPKKRYTR